MGRLQRDQSQFFYSFCLDEVVPPDHLVRRLDRTLDLRWLHNALAPYYSHTGRPSIDPELMLRMLILGYVFAIRSERQLCCEVQVNLAYRWFCRLGLEDNIPDHSAFSRARHERFREGEVFRLLFESVVETCIGDGLVGGKSLSVDASLIRADVNQVKRIAGDHPMNWPDAGEVSRAVKEYLNTLDKQAPETGKGVRQTRPPKAVSLTDPQAAWVVTRKKRSIFAYDANYLIDNKLGIIVDAEGTRANRIEENRVSVSMVERVITRFGLKPERIAADTAYGSSKTLKSLTDLGLEPHIPVWDKSRRGDGTLERADFCYDEERDVYICPQGKILKTTGKIYSDNSVRYRARTKDCKTCPIKDRCCPNTPQRKIPRDAHEGIREHVRGLAETPGFKRSRDERKKVEMAFAHMKRIFKLDRLRLRGLTGARDEVLLTATAQNLRKLARYVHPPPTCPQTRRNP